MVDLRKKGVRSPRYPGLTLTDAIERIRLIHDYDKRTPTKPDDILSQLGLAIGSGPANRILAALKQYGLLVEADDGLLKVSDTAYKILHLSEESPERSSALREAASSPQIIRELVQQYPHGLPSDSSLADFLITEKNFNPEAVPFFTRVAREAFLLGKLDQSSDEEPYDSANPAKPQEPVELRPSRFRAKLPLRHEFVPSEVSTGEFAPALHYPLSQHCIGVVKFHGFVTQSDVDRLIKFLELSRAAFPATVPDALASK